LPKSKSNLIAPGKLFKSIFAKQFGKLDLPSSLFLMSKKDWRMMLMGAGAGECFGVFLHFFFCIKINCFAQLAVFPRPSIRPLDHYCISQLPRGETLQAKFFSIWGQPFSEGGGGRMATLLQIDGDGLYRCMYIVPSRSLQSV